MSWRERLAKLIVGAGGKRADLPMDVYHGTKAVFPEFKRQSIADAYTIDRALGTHVAPDPRLSGAFAVPGSTPELYNTMSAAGYDSLKQSPHIIPLKAPPDEAFLQVHQPFYPHAKPNEPAWRGVKTDSVAVDSSAAVEAFLHDPDLLKHHLQTSRRFAEPDARSLSRALVAGEKPTIEGRARSLQEFTENFGPPVGDDAKQRVVDLARQSWTDKGYAGLKYINTAPMEAGAPGVTDATSYIVFDPADLRSRFAKMATDAASLRSRDLMRGVAVGAPALGGAFAMDQYEVAP